LFEGHAPPSLVFSSQSDSSKIWIVSFLYNSHIVPVNQGQKSTHPSPAIAYADAKTVLSCSQHIAGGHGVHRELLYAARVHRSGLGGSMG